MKHSDKKGLKVFLVLFAVAAVVVSVVLCANRESDDCVRMPDVYDMNTSEAFRMLTIEGFKVVNVPYPNTDNKPEKTVIKTKPARNEKVESGAMVILYESQGDDSRYFPPQAFYSKESDTYLIAAVGINGTQAYMKIEDYYASGDFMDEYEKYTEIITDEIELENYQEQLYRMYKEAVYEYPISVEYILVPLYDEKGKKVVDYFRNEYSAKPLIPENEVVSPETDLQSNEDIVVEDYTIDDTDTINILLSHYGFKAEKTQKGYEISSADNSTDIRICFSGFKSDTSAVIKDSHGNTLTLEYFDPYQVFIDTIDITNDGINDIIITEHISGTGIIHNMFIIVNGEDLSEISVDMGGVEKKIMDFVNSYEFVNFISGAVALYSANDFWTGREFDETETDRFFVAVNPAIIGTNLFKDNNTLTANVKIYGGLFVNSDGSHVTGEVNFGLIKNNNGINAETKYTDIYKADVVFGYEDGVLKVSDMVFVNENKLIPTIGINGVEGCLRPENLHNGGEKYEIRTEPITDEEQLTRIREQLYPEYGDMIYDSSIYKEERLVPLYDAKSETVVDQFAIVNDVIVKTADGTIITHADTESPAYYSVANPEEEQS